MTDSYCRVHGEPGRPGYEWPCPIDLEEGELPCPHFAEEMERRLAEYGRGNFWRMERVPEGMLFHEYIGHRPTGVTRLFEVPPAPPPTS